MVSQTVELLRARVAWGGYACGSMSVYTCMQVARVRVRHAWAQFFFKQAGEH